MNLFRFCKSFIIEKITFFTIFKKSIGITKNIYIKKIISEKKIKEEIKKIKKKLFTKHDVINLRYLDMNVGHELYDEYLRVNNKNELDLQV